MKKFKTTHKKLLSLLLVMIMLVSIAPANLFSVTASAVSGSEIVAYARQFLGYQYVYGTAGPNTFDCSGFTKYVFGHFGISLPHSTYTLWNNSTSYGTVVATGSTANAKAGDLILWEGHVAIYTENGYCVEALNENYDVTDKVKVNSHTNGMNYKVIRVYGVSDDTSKPTNLKISSNRTVIGVGDVVNFTYSIDGASNKSIGIDKDGKRYKTISVNQNLGEIAYTFDEPGTYCCIIEGSNSMGYNCSSGIYITVISSAPKDLSINANHTSIGVGDSVVFNYKIVGATSQCIGIDKNGTRYANVEAKNTEGTSSYTFNEAGTYCCIIEGYNKVGYSCSQGIYITVIDSAPKNCMITADKTYVDVGEEVIFNYKILGATVQGIGIDRNGVRYANIEAKKDEGFSSYTFKDAGTYCCIIEGYNNIGYNCSDGVWITVGKSCSITYNPNGGKNAPANQTKKYGESITLSSTVPTRDGYNFLGWSTDSNATVPEYLPGDTYSENKELTLYAVWEEVKETKDIMGTIKTFGDPTDEVYVDFYKPGESESCGYTIFRGDAEEFCIGGIQQGEYIIKISKPNHVTREYSVVVDKDIELDIQLNLIGDVDGNGKVNITDYNAILRHVKKTGTLDGYSFDCADIDDNGKILVTDYNAVLRHVKKTDTLW